ncbi:DUF296 domain-containing protein [Dyella monticola]|uniref:DUF296 domain-containing protein n=1 Tax=Dyella monticola TaxID=1927958 RepID=A0A370WTI4_9GAMM|nr:DUF296 domain-containing protein [Dyella monticola]RDS79317.1 DUF296 domain-containing protein [Dyella monticola]
MHHQLIRHGQGSRTWSIVLDAGDEVNTCLQDFARREVLSATRFTAIGTLHDAVLGYFESEKQSYRRDALDQPTQIVSLVGDIALHNGRPRIHIRAVLGNGDGSTVDARLLEGRVKSTMEIVMTEAPVRLHKDYDADAGLALFKHGGSAA